MPDPLLVDTCAAIWILEDGPLSPASITALDTAFDQGLATFVSTVTAWEIGMLLSKGRLTMRRNALSSYRMLLDDAGMTEHAMTPEILIASSNLPGTPPRDSFDRIVVATARTSRLTILTRDRLILGYAEAGHVAAIAC
ncbi:type II toxin-antitoxin system VapC family toxin [Oharaeibacter diazotrophicus]|uniref:PIN domain nuclease of toxin-antitoxin system n=1 Tax=Oharaeibacter diazotrophicus TaxID=1920512 RepID=A0A4R6RBX5_9HYPH|nr:type II toxin-antitoxin system VapC family toxin [Oharaeibacter diazotrophicus]TDP83592.1 PIN domain nuclease of toxin-antitoxin system [Oharaeibacter diazotrophicus]BBE72425.1 hypothetical protein OHA_1_02015 [Pleomorphomonas sp. SM30]GLS79195.1 hypothetical protein GCM10007904_45320 [Oharaeibacter diazotrophicus]